MSIVDYLGVMFITASMLNALKRAKGIRYFNQRFKAAGLKLDFGALPLGSGSRMKSTLLLRTSAGRESGSIEPSRGHRYR